MAANQKRRAKTEVTFNLTMMLPPDVTIQDAQKYVKEAVCGWKGGSNSDEPITQLDRETVRVGLQKKVVTY